MVTVSKKLAKDAVTYLSPHAVLPLSSARVAVRQFGLQEAKDVDFVAVEEPLEIQLGWLTESGIEYRKLAVTMRTPGQDFELAAGFLFTEGIISTQDLVAKFERVLDDANGKTNGNVVRIMLREQPSIDWSSVERNFYVSSSCGVCGKASLDAIKTHAKYSLKDNDFHLSSAAVAALPAQLSALQKVFAGTGGIHAAALFNQSVVSGEAYEDIGRHNAVDKLIGANYRSGSLPISECGMLVSGRASFELVQKAAMAGCPMLAAVGAPSSLAIDLAWETDMTLIGFLRDGRFNVYTCPSRID
jgi:FdhD protein